MFAVFFRNYQLQLFLLEYTGETFVPQILFYVADDWSTL